MRYILVLSLLLSGCSNMQMVKGTTELPQNAVIVAHGDSLTKGVTGASEHPLEPYTAQIDAKLTVYNTGMMGENGKQIRDRLDYDVLSRNPDLMILWCCQNSLNIHETADKIMSEYIVPMVETARSMGVQSMLITPGYWPRIDVDGNPDEKKENLYTLQRLIVDYAKANGLYALLIRSYDSEDGTHPNAKQYKKIGKLVNAALK